MAIRIPRTTRTRQVRLPQTNNLRLVQAARTDLAGDIGSAINNLGQRILDVENEKAKIRVQNDIINAESELSREIQKRNNKLFQSRYDFSPKTLPDKIQEGKDYIDDFLRNKFSDRPEMQKYFGKLKFDAYKLNEKFLYENSNRKFKQQTISTHEDNLTSLAESIEAQTPGSAMFSNFYQKIESLDLSRKNANNVGANYDKEEEEKQFKLLIMKKILSKNSFIDPVTEQRVLDYKTIRANLNNTDFTAIGGEQLTDDLRKELKTYYEKSDRKFRDFQANFIKSENAKLFLRAEKIEDNPTIGLLQKAEQIEKLNFIGQEGRTLKEGLIKDLENEALKGKPSAITGLAKNYVEDKIITGEIGSVGERVIRDQAIFELFKSKEGKRKIKENKAVSLFDMMVEGLLPRKEIYDGGQISQLIKEVGAEPERAKAFDAFIKARLPQILGKKTSAILSDSAIARGDFFTSSMRKKFREGIEKGIPYQDLLRPTNGINPNPNYIYTEEGLTIENGGFLPTLNVITQEAIASTGVQTKIDYPKEIEKLNVILKEKIKTMPFDELEQTEEYKRREKFRKQYKQQQQEKEK